MSTLDMVPNDQFRVYIGKENHQPWNNDLRYSRIEKLEVKDLSLNLGNPTEQCLHEVENSPFKKPTGTYGYLLPQRFNTRDREKLPSNA